MILPGVDRADSNLSVPLDGRLGQQNPAPGESLSSLTRGVQVKGSLYLEEKLFPVLPITFPALRRGLFYQQSSFRPPFLRVVLLHEIFLWLHFDSLDDFRYNRSVVRRHHLTQLVEAGWPFGMLGVPEHVLYLPFGDARG